MGKRKALEGAKKKEPAAKKKKTTASSDVKEEEAFPRGGKNVLSSLEVRKIHEQVKQDLFSSSAKKPSVNTKVKKKTVPTKKKAKKKVEKDDDEVMDDSFEGILKRLDKEAPVLAETLNHSMIDVDQRQKSVNSLLFQSLVEGATIVGSIKEIRPLKLLITIPGSLTVVASITEISDELNKRMENIDKMSDDSDEENDFELSSLFQVGQLVRCIVIGTKSVEKKKKGKQNQEVRTKKEIHVSLKPSLINKDRLRTISSGVTIYGAVAAEEDYGYIIHFGEKQTGFLKKSKKHKRTLQVGEPVECLVRSSYVPKKSTAIPVTLNGAGTQIMTQTELSLQALCAGMLTSVKIINIVESGLIVRLLDFFNASIPLCQLDVTGDSLSERFNKGDHVTARILFIDYENKTISMGCKSHIVEWTPYQFPLQVGDIFEEASVVKAINNLGLYVEIPTEPPQLSFVHISNISDSRTPPNVQEKFPVGKTVSCRVIDVNYADGIAVLSMKKSVLELDFLQHSDLSPGTQIRGSVIAIEDFGILVKISEKMIGLIPLLHLADVTIRKPAAKFKIDQKVKCRVLSVDPKEKKVTLTAKKTLLNSKSTIITSYDTPPGTISHGFIKSIKPNGVTVGFYNRVTAFAPRHEITDDQSPLDTLFNVGQPVQCRVVSASENRMLVSFRVVEDTNAYDALELGSRQSGEIIQTQNDYLVVQLDCGVRGHFRKYHFSDIPSICDNWMTYFTNNKKVSDLMVVSKPAHRPVELTQKAVLLKGQKNDEIPSSVEDLSVGMIVYGFVKRISTIGIHIGFLGDLLGFVPKAQIADEFVENPSNYFVLGQSVRAYVAELHDTKLILSLKQSLCATDCTEMIKQYFVEEKLLFRTLKRKNKKNKLASIEVGEIVTGTITDITEIGILVQIDKHTKGLLLDKHVGDNKEKKVGDSIRARVLDISQPDANQRIMDLSASKDLLKIKKTPKKTSAGKEYTVRVELVKTKYLVVSYDSRIGYVAIGDYNTFVYGDPFSIYKPKQELTVMLNASTFESLYSRALLFSVPLTTVAKKNIDKQDIMSLADIQPGMLVTGKIERIVSHTMKVSVGLHVIGHVNVTEVIDEPSRESPFKAYEVGQTVTAKVLTMREVASNRHLPISHQNPVTHRRLELTLRPSKVNLPPPELGEPLLTWKNANEFIGKSILVAVYAIQQRTCSLGVHISSEIDGNIPVNFLRKTTGSFPKRLATHFQLGEILRCRVAFVDEKYKKISVSMRLDEEDPFERLQKPGEMVLGKIVKRIIGRGLLVEVAPRLLGFVSMTEITDEYVKRPEKITRVNMFHRFVVLPRLESDKNMPLSMRKSRVKSDAPEPTNPVINSIDELKEDQIVSGYVCEFQKGEGVTVALSRTVQAFVPHDELADRVSKDQEKFFSGGRLVRGRIIDINPDAKHNVVMTLKKSRVIGDISEDISDAKINIRNISKGQKLKGYVRYVKEYGILIEIKHSNRLMGLCHKSEISDKKNLKWQEIFAEGDYVKVVVLHVDPEKKKLSLGMKPSYFTDDDIEFDSDEEEDDEGPATTDSLLVDDDSSDDEAESILSRARMQSAQNEDSDDDMEMEGGESMSEDSEENDSEESVPVKNALGTTSFEWNDFTVAPTNRAAEMEDSEESEESEEEEKGQSQRSKKLAKQREAEDVAAKEESLLADERPPETIADYERLIVSSPNDSFLWIKYMAFLLSITEIEKARAVVERGLKRINLREEGEKLNLWIAFMNLELAYGSRSSLDKVIERALSYNNPKIVYQRLVDIYENAEKLDEAEEVFQKMLKKYKRSKGIWLKYCTFKMTHGESEEAHKAFQRAIQLLPQRKHIPLINKYAQLEYKHGDPERGRTMFEGVISNYPKKIDIWSVYIDMEIKYISDIEAIRRIFERATSLTLSSKKMKFLFTRYLNFEKENGDENTVEHVKQKVVEFLENTSK